MAVFESPVDIANRSCQHCGVTRITAFTDDSVQASECSFVYDKVREAEQRRNIWRFGIRRAVLRPIDTNTRFYTPAAWSSGTTYAHGAVVSYDGSYWSSAAGGNTANIPNTGLGFWDIYCGPLTVNLYDSTIAYYSGELVYLSGFTTPYLSLTNSNVDTPPTSNWLTLGGTIAASSFVYPIGSGPSDQSATRNVFRLPNGFLREAPQDPKAGSVSILGAPSGLTYNDWEFEGNYIVSRTAYPLVFRFAAEITSVPAMDPMFCEGLGARIGMEIVQRVTQSSGKFSEIVSKYKAFMDEARLVNGIETGPTEPPEDDYIVCRA